MSRIKPGLVEAIIAEVAKYPLIYDHRNRDFKNMKKKNEVWNEIADTVGMESGELVMQKWKNLRDSYSKYKKHSLLPAFDESGLRNGLVNWRWAQPMSFLEPYIGATKYRNNKQSTNDSDEIIAYEIETESESEAEPEDLKTVLEETEDKKEIAVTKKFNLDSSSSQDKGTPKVRKRKLDNIDQVILEPFHNNERSSDKVDVTSLDMTDFFFLSYAETFKRLNRKSQAILKMKMAKLFSEVELEEIEEDPIRLKHKEEY